VKEDKMNTSHVRSISWNQFSLKYDPLKRGSQGQDQENLFFHPGSSKGPERSLISYKIDSAHGAIKAEIIDSKSGKVIREIKVKPDISMIFPKGSFFDSVM
jgi:hypothetical protein